MGKSLCKMIQQLLYGYGWVVVIFEVRIHAGRTRKGLKHGGVGLWRDSQGKCGLPRDLTCQRLCGQCVAVGEENPKGCIACLSLLHNHSCFWGKMHPFPGASFPAPRKPLAIFLRIYFEMYNLFITLLFWGKWASRYFEITNFNDSSLHENSLGFISSTA